MSRDIDPNLYLVTYNNIKGEKVSVKRRALTGHEAMNRVRSSVHPAPAKNIKFRLLKVKR